MDANDSMNTILAMTVSDRTHKPIIAYDVIHSKLIILVLTWNGDLMLAADFHAMYWCNSGTVSPPRILNVRLYNGTVGSAQ